MPESWKAVPLNAGALAAIIAGVAATVFAVHGIQLWVDNRVDDALDNRLAPIERRLERVQASAAQIERQQRVRDDRQQKMLQEILGRLENSE